MFRPRETKKRRRRRLRFNITLFTLEGGTMQTSAQQQPERSDRAGQERVTRGVTQCEVPARLVYEAAMLQQWLVTGGEDIYSNVFIKAVTP